MNIGIRQTAHVGVEYDLFVKKSARSTLLPLFVLAVSISGLFAQPARHGFVHAHAEELVDGGGQPVFLRGINLGNWFEVEGYMFHFDGGPQSPREIEELTRAVRD